MHPATPNRYLSIKPDGWRVKDWEELTHVTREILQDYLSKYIPDIVKTTSKKAVLEIAVASMSSNSEIEPLLRGILEKWRKYAFKNGARPRIEFYV